MSWRRYCYRFYKVAQGWIAPGLRHCQVEYAERLAATVQPGCVWLELGCGHEMLRSWSVQPAVLKSLLAKPKVLVGLDLCMDSLVQHQLIQNKVCGDVVTLPFKDASFDLVAANMVVEHVRQAAGLLREVNRILTPGGLFVFHTTNRSHYMFWVASLVPQGLRNKVIWFLQRRKESDVFPTEYCINTPKDIRRLAAESDFEIARLDTLESESMTMALGPLVLFELLITRLLMFRPMKDFRSNLIVVLAKAKSTPETAGV